MNLTIFGDIIQITHEKTITRNATDFTYIGSTTNSSHNVFIAVFGDDIQLELDTYNRNIVLEPVGNAHVVKSANDVAFGSENEGGGQFSLNPNYQQIIQNTPIPSNMKPISLFDFGDNG